MAATLTTDRVDDIVHQSDALTYDCEEKPKQSLKRQARVAGQALVGDPTRAAQFAATERAIRSFEKLQPGWDTYEAKPSDKKAINYSLQLLGRLRSIVDATNPTVSPISGGVFIEWRTSDCYLYFEVDGQSVVYSLEVQGNPVTSGEDSFYDVSRACEIVSMML